MGEYLKPPKRQPKGRAQIPPISKKRAEREAAERAAGIFKEKKPIPQVSAKRKQQMDAGLFKMEPGKPLNRISAKQAAIERKKSELYRKRSEDERPFCRGCGSYTSPLSNSHRIGQADKKNVVNPENLDTYCMDGRNCHGDWECGRVYRLDNGDEVLGWLAGEDWQRYVAKVYQMLDRITDDELSLEDLPGWVEVHVLVATK